MLKVKDSQNIVTVQNPKGLLECKGSQEGLLEIRDPEKLLEYNKPHICLECETPQAVATILTTPRDWQTAENKPCYIIVLYVASRFIAKGY